MPVNPEGLKWSDREIIRFFNIYRKYEFLCQLNTHEENHLTKRVKENISKLMLELNDVGFSIGNESSLIRKINALRDAYLNEYIKVEKSRRNCTAADDVYKPTIVWYEAASSLCHWKITAILEYYKEDLKQLCTPKKKAETEELRKHRLAYSNVSLDKEKKEKINKKLPDKKKKQKNDEEESESDSEDKIKAALMNKKSSTVGRGKDISTIVEGEKEECVYEKEEDEEVAPKRKKQELNNYNEDGEANFEEPKQNGATQKYEPKCVILSKKLNKLVGNCVASSRLNLLSKENEVEVKRNIQKGIVEVTVVRKSSSSPRISIVRRSSPTHLNSEEPDYAKLKLCLRKLLSKENKVELKQKIQKGINEVSDGDKSSSSPRLIYFIRRPSPTHLDKMEAALVSKKPSTVGRGKDISTIVEGEKEECVYDNEEEEEKEEEELGIGTGKEMRMEEEESERMKKQVDINKNLEIEKEAAEEIKNSENDDDIEKEVVTPKKKGRIAEDVDDDEVAPKRKKQELNNDNEDGEANSEEPKQNGATQEYTSTSAFLSNKFDEQIFCDYVASSLRNLRSEENKVKLKRKIQKCILEVSEVDKSSSALAHLKKTTETTQEKYLDKLNDRIGTNNFDTEDIDDIEITIKEEPVESETGLFVDSFSFSEDTDTLTPASKKQKTDIKTESNLEETLNMISGNYLSDTKKAKEFESFGANIAAQLNNMQFINAIELQPKIQHLISQYRLNCAHSKIKQLQT